ncbi:hypothetical protein HAX54_014472 [Datura stramonium]|uniref:MADS-box domain-containing protein n=1 Tax=Datura stramonium TaxID=4076 RepID=A0ABS8RIU2_DATST|nr:hypothetical protein [Datura stramonium]
MVKLTGRKKIEIVRMQNQNNLHVTFFKRRAGLFKKATKLSTLCGVEGVTVVFSPNNNRVYSIGHPSVNSVVDESLGVIPPPNTNVRNPLIEPHQNANVGRERPSSDSNARPSETH